MILLLSSFGSHHERIGRSCQNGFDEGAVGVGSPHAQAVLEAAKAPALRQSGR